MWAVHANEGVPAEACKLSMFTLYFRIEEVDLLYTAEGEDSFS